MTRGKGHRNQRADPQHSAAAYLMAAEPDGRRPTRAQLLALMQQQGETKKDGSYVLGRCPLHNGESLKLSSRNMLKCFGGCPDEDIWRWVTDQLKRDEPRDERPRNRQRGQNKKDLSKTDGEWHVLNRPPDIAYEFRSHTGELVAVHGRWNFHDARGDPDKTFRWRLPEGEYSGGLGGMPQHKIPLYGTHELPEKAPAVCLVEGEKAADACRAAGLFAMCGPEGSSQRKWGTALDVMAGRTVYLWPDNDKVGRDLMVGADQELRKIAKDVIWLRPEAGPKDDAYDYFVRDKRSVGDLLSGGLKETSIEVLDGDHFRIRVPVLGSIYAFEAENILRSARAIDCELTVRDESPQGEPIPMRRRINWLSASAVEGLARALGNHFGKERDTGINWSRMVNEVSARIIDAFGEVSKVVQVAEVPSAGDQTFVVDEMIPEHQPTIIFGDGESSKTWMALDMALSVVWGSDWHGRPVKQGGVLLIDYESSLIGFRLRRLLEGRELHGAILPDLPFYYRDAEGVPLYELRDEIRRFCDEHPDIVLIIIDSGADACGGPPEQSEPTLEYFRALGYIGKTSLTICHNRGQSLIPGDVSHTMRPYGNRYWHNRARRTFYVASNAEEGSSQFDVVLTCRKVNDGPKPDRFAVHMTFDDSDRENPGAVESRQGNIREVGGGNTELTRTSREQIEIAIAAKGGQATVAEIAELTKLTAGAVRTTLGRHSTAFVQVPSDGRAATWGLLARGLS